MNELTKKERITLACRNQMPDRVPVSPDISNMVPCRRTGRDFWHVYVNNNPPLWKAYLEAAEFFAFEAWLSYGEFRYVLPHPVPSSEKVLTFADHWEKWTTHHTPAGDLTECMYSPAWDAPTWTEKLIKSFPEDFEKFRHLMQEPIALDDETYRQQVKALGDNGIVSVCIVPPGFPEFLQYFHGNLEALTYAMTDYPDEFDELVALSTAACLRKTELAIEAGVESILTGGSGSITLQSPKIFDRFCLPVIKQQTKMCREAGVLSCIHSCGKELHILEACARETDLDFINPLEVPPMGDCTLSECKRRFGHKLALMGNLHTTQTMLFGSAEQVRRESLQAILDAGEGGGFILSTGDQCGRDTPDENIRAMVRAAKDYGRYPLDTAAIRQALCPDAPC